MIYLDTTNINNYAQKVLGNESLQFDREGSTLYWTSNDLQIELTESEFFNMIADELRDWLGEFYFEGDDAESPHYTGSYK